MYHGSVIVTAGCAGIGGEITKFLLQRGYAVFPTSRSADNGSAFLSTLESPLKERCFPTELSLDSEEEIDRFCGTLENEPVYALINCAAERIGSLNPYENSFAEWHRHFKTDVYATAYLTAQVVKRAIKQDGRVVNLSSFYSVVVPDNRIYDEKMIPSGMIYGTAKAALNYITRYMAAQYAPERITVNAVLPGGVHDDRKQTKSFQEKYANKTPMRRMATANEFNDAVAFFLSEENGFCTGQLLVIDGGWSLW